MGQGNIMIKLKCINTQCNYCYEVTEAELENNYQYHKTCLICGSQLQVINTKEIVNKDIYTRAEEYLNKWLNELGIEGTMEMLERNKNQSTYRIYAELLKKRGIII